MKLLQAAAGFVGGKKQLALLLGLVQPLLGKLVADLHHAPDRLLLRAADIGLAHHPVANPACRHSESRSCRGSAMSQ